MNADTNQKNISNEHPRPQYEPPQLHSLDASETRSGFTGASEAAFPNFMPQSGLSVS